MTVIDPLARHVFDNRGTLNYPGDVRDHLLGGIFGPSYMRELLIVVEVSYDAELDLTTGRTRIANQDDVDSIDESTLPYPQARSITAPAEWRRLKLEASAAAFGRPNT